MPNKSENSLKSGKARNIMRELKFVVLFASIFLFVSPAFATPSNLYWHSYDYYSIELNGNGNAFVVGTVTLQALTTQPVNSITLEIPYTGVTFYRVLENGIYYNPPCVNIPCLQVPCAPCNTYKPSSFLNYTTQTLSDSTLVTINLVYPIQNDTDVTISVIFSTQNIAQKTFQGYEFTFDTVKDPNALIRSLSANVAVPENTYLKGKPSFDIQYRASEVASQSLQASPDAVVGILPPQGGNAQYTASNLMPGESFTISGLFGSNWFLLYAQEIGAVIVLLIVFAVIGKYFLADKLRGIFARREGEERVSRRKSEFSFARPIICGFISSLIFIGVYYLLSSLIGSGFYGGDYIAGTTLLVLNAVFVLLSIFGLPFYLATRYSRGEGILAAIISLVLSFLLLILFMPQYSPPIIYAAVKGMSESLGGASNGTATAVSSQ